MSKSIIRQSGGPLFARGYYDNSLGDFMNSFFKSANENSFTVDIIEKGDHYELEADLPGFHKKEIEIKLKDDLLTISAEKKEEKTTEKDHYITNERRGSYRTRTFALPYVKEDEVTAEYKEGVLKIKLPKAKEVEKKDHTIPIK